MYNITVLQGTVMGYDLVIKEEAEKLRSKGIPYSSITKQLGVPKSTLSTWFNKKYKHIYKDKQKEHLKKARVIALAAKRKNVAMRNTAIVEKVRGNLATYPRQNIGFMKTIIATLYWGEGTKDPNGGLTLTNTDPTLVNLYITLLRKCYSLEENKFWVRLHIHHYHDRNECLRYWSKILKIPLNRFAEPYLKPRSKTKKFRENFMGICSVYYGSSDIKRELMEINKQLQEWYCK